MKAIFRKKLGHGDTQRSHRDTQKRKSSAYLAFALCISVSQLYAQPDDRAPVTVRYPDKTHLRDLQTSHDYQYGNDAPPPENPIARFFSWLWSKLGEFFGSEAYQNVWQYVVLAAIAGLVVYLLMKANVLDFLFPKKAQSSGLDYENVAENIHEIDFDAAIDEAVTKHNYRLGVRLLYLQTLKRLTDAQRIAYKPDKTNRQYVYELANTPLQAHFEKLTRQFELVWYGDFPVNYAQFTAIQTEFEQFKQHDAVTHSGVGLN